MAFRAIVFFISQDEGERRYQLGKDLSETQISNPYLEVCLRMGGSEGMYL